MNNYTRRLHFIFVSFFVCVLICSCSKNSNRIYIDSWQYSFDDEVYSVLQENDLPSVYELVPNRMGYIYLKSDFYIPENAQISSYGLCFGRILLASEIYFNGRIVMKTGLFPPKKFSNGTNCNFISLRNGYVRFNDKNELKIKLYVEGNGGIFTTPFISEYNDAFNYYSVSNFFHSTILLVAATFLLFTSLIYLIMFIKMQNDPTMLLFSILSAMTILFIFPSFIGNFPWLIGFMDYNWFIKLFQGVAGFFTAFLAVSFSLHYLGVRQPPKFVFLRLFLLLIGILYCLIVPNVQSFYKFMPLTSILVFFQIIPVVPAIIIGRKIRAYVFSMLAKGESPFGAPGAPAQMMKSPMQAGAGRPPKGIMKMIFGAGGPPPKARMPQFGPPSMQQGETKGFMRPPIMGAGGPPPGISFPTDGKIDDIVLAQMEFAQSSLGTVKQLVTGYIPVYSSLVLDIILRYAFGLTDILFLPLFGWLITLIVFLFMLITNFAKIRHRGESIAGRLREIVFKSTQELKQKAEELEKKNIQSEKEIDMAAQVQKMFYCVKSDFLDWDIAVKFQPLAGVSGDLYDFYEFENKLRGFGLFDVSGHGLSAALITMIAKNTIFRTFRSSLPLTLEEAILRINTEIIHAKGNIENYLTGVLFRIDKEDSSKIEMVNAGSPYPILKRHNAPSVFLKPEIDNPKAQHGMLGFEGIDVAFSKIPFDFNDNDTIILYTDGLTEAENESGEQYGMERLLALVEKIPAYSDAKVILSAIEADVNFFIGKKPLEDDMTIVVIQRKEGVELIEDLEDLEVLEEL